MALPAPTPPVAAAHAQVPWHWRLREQLSSYLPLLLMLLLALSTWWLVKNSPQPEEPRGAVVPRHVPDYTMRHFAVQRYAPDGRLRVRIEGEQLRHYPDTDTVEIDTVRIRALGDQGRVTVATARQAVANGDASEVQLLGGAHVVSRAGEEEPLEFEGEFLQAFLNTERLRSHLPVQVRHGSNVLRAQGMDYDNLSRTLQLKGKVHATFAPARRGGR
ncbi:LPS export ABC transporter periplasmic protein LptC [Ideonella sp. BN130291]|uniref:LPS export ABC transporter periplasmic protein LptC n=1 Tax=Ideonella sp. BN130291 TaxID=3112940 RepID=UPI002E25D744|nr:LPS export ABC transporter periplasmic protein LptC [Ideonella sp. BN130291]